MKEIDYIIFYEHVAREYESVLRLQSKLNTRGLKGVVLPIHYWRYASIAFFKPKCVVMPFLYGRDIDQHLKIQKVYGETLIININSEQILDNNSKKSNLPKDTYSRSATQCVWGERFAKELINCGVDKRNIFHTGSIRHDILNELKKEKNSSHEAILIPTSFSKTFVSPEYVEKINLDKQTLKERIKHVTQIRNIFFKDILDLANRYNEKIFTLRPHPYVELEHYKKVFLEVNNEKKLPENIIIERDGTIQEALVSVEKVISWFTTTIVDAYLMNKEIMIYDPIDSTEKINSELFRLTPKANSFKKIEEFVSSESNSQSISALDSYIKHVYGTIDGRATDRLSYLIHAKVQKKKHGKKINKIEYFKALLKTVYIDGAKYLLLKLGILGNFVPFYSGIQEDHKFNIWPGAKNEKVVKYSLKLTDTGFKFEEV